jgi:hypothetical protein
MEARDLPSRAEASAFAARHPSGWPTSRRPSQYARVIAANRAKRAATFDALIASMNESVLGLEIALHAVSRRSLAEAANG